MAAVRAPRLSSVSAPSVKPAPQRQRLSGKAAAARLVLPASEAPLLSCLQWGMLHAIESAGKLIGQVLDAPNEVPEFWDSGELLAYRVLLTKLSDKLEGKRADAEMREFGLPPGDRLHRVVCWPPVGKRFLLTLPQHIVFCALVDAHLQAGSGEVDEVTLLEKAGVPGKRRLKKLFRNSPAWNTLIVAGQQRGMFRLPPPKGWDDDGDEN